MLPRLVLFSVFVLVAGGCGGSSSSSPPVGGPPTVTATAPAPTVSVRAKTATTPTVPSPVTTSHTTTTSSAQKRSLRISLSTDGHSPNAGRPWHFTVRAKDSHGRPVGGTAIPRVLLSGKIIDTIGWFAFAHGIFRHVIVWTSDKKGQPLVFRVEVQANGGVKNLDYPILVK